MYYTLTQKGGGLLLVLMLLSNISASSQTRQKYRTFDGSNNNQLYAQWGAASNPLFRELPSEYSDGLNALAGAGRPNPRHVSNRLANEIEDVHNRRDMAGLFYIWGQFLDHDLTNTPAGTEKMPIPLPSDESKFSNPISFTRSAVFPNSGINTPREQRNMTTSWIDASMVYGNNQVDANWLRTFTNGKLWVSNGNLLPYNTTNRQKSGNLDPSAPKMDDDRGRTQKTFAAGDRRAAENPGLTSLHTTFVREHNRICDRLMSQGYRDDETIYQIARKEVGALIQVITYNQWLSALGVSLNSYAGYNASVRPDIRNTFAAAAYRWHTMVENDIIFRDNECRGVGPVELPLKDVFFNIGIVEKYDIGVLLKGLSVHRQYETDLKVNSGLRNFLFGSLGTDLVAINIQRGRDHGLPNYNKVREFYTGSRATSFSDITSDGYIAGRLKELYGSVDNVDLWVGLFAEWHLDGKSIGKTLDAIIRSQFESLRDGDFYFYQNDPELSAERSRIASTTLGEIISRNSSAGNFQSNVFLRKHCRSNGDDLAHSACNTAPAQYDGWTFLGRTSNKSLYKWNGTNANYDEAKQIAKRIGGSLIQPADAATNSYISSFIAAGTGAWLDMGRNGLNKWQTTGFFDLNDAFIPGITPSYQNWGIGEPNNVGGIENRAMIGANGKWNDVTENATPLLIAEVECDHSPELESCLTASYFNNTTLSGTPIVVRSETNLDNDWGVFSPIPDVVKTDNFSVRYEGSIVAPETGTYTFSINADDGVRLWVNNIQIINRWFYNSGTITGTCYLTKGATVPLKLEYYDAGGSAILKCNWSQPKTYANELTFSTLKASYFENKTLSGTPIVTRSESKINFDWGYGSPLPLKTGLFGIPIIGSNSTDNFSARFEGTMIAPTTGIYTYNVIADDGIRVWIDNKLVIDQWRTQLWATNYSAEVFSVAGKTVPVRVEYYENGLSAVCKMTCTTPTLGNSSMKFKGCPRQLIKPASFSSDECYAISARHSGKILEVAALTTLDGINIQQNDWREAKNQIWKIKSEEPDYFRIESTANSNKVLQVNASANTDGAKANQWTWTNGNNQKWKFTRNSEGYYSITAKHSQKALDVYGVDRNSGASLVQWANTNSNNQQFAVSIVGCPSYANLRSNAYEIVARRDGGKAIIHWASNLTDVVHYDIERMDFNTQIFKTIASVQNQVNPNELEHYVGYDDKPITGENYYRVVAYLKDGTKVETELKNVDFSNLDELNVYPNPASDELNIDLSKFGHESNPEPTTIYLYDSFGRILATQQMDFATKNARIDVSQYPSGRYLIRVAANGREGITKQVMILHQ